MRNITRYAATKDCEGKMHKLIKNTLYKKGDLFVTLFITLIINF